MLLDSYVLVHHNPHCSPLPTQSPGTHSCFLLPSVGSKDMIPALDGRVSEEYGWGTHGLYTDFLGKEAGNGFEGCSSGRGSPLEAIAIIQAEDVRDLEICHRGENSKHGAVAFPSTLVCFGGLGKCGRG